MNNSITLHDIEDTTVRWLREEAMRRGMKVEALIVELINAGMKQDMGKTLLKTYHDLDSLAGTWDSEQSDQFLKAIGEFEQVDEKLWV